VKALYHIFTEQKDEPNEYAIRATGDVVVGDIIRFKEAVFTGSYRKPKYAGDRTIEAEVIKDSYGERKQQHTFTLKIIHSSGTEALEPGTTVRRKGRNVYRNGVQRQKWDNEEAREEARTEKHTRGDIARQQIGARRNTPYGEALYHIFTESKSVTVYHASLARNFESIASSMSLKPSEKTNWGGELGAGSEGRVYFTNSREQAEYYGNILARDIGDPGEFLAVLRVEVPEEWLEQDPDDLHSSFTEREVPLEGKSQVWSGKDWRALTRSVVEVIGSREWDEYEPENFVSKTVLDEGKEEVVYHGTSANSARNIEKYGFKANLRITGMSSQPIDEFIFVTPSKKGGEWFAYTNFRNKDQGIVKAMLSGRLYKVPGRVFEYEAMSVFAREYGLIKSEEHHLDLPKIAEKLRELGFSGIAYKDSSSGFMAYAVLPETLQVMGTMDIEEVYDKDLLESGLSVKIDQWLKEYGVEIPPDRAASSNSSFILRDGTVIEVPSHYKAVCKFYLMELADEQDIDMFQKEGKLVRVSGWGGTEFGIAFSDRITFEQLGVIRQIDAVSRGLAWEEIGPQGSTGEDLASLEWYIEDENLLESVPSKYKSKWWSDDYTNYEPYEDKESHWGIHQVGFNISASGRINLGYNVGETHRDLMVGTGDDETVHSGIYSFGYKREEPTLWLYPNAVNVLNDGMRQGLASLIGVHMITAETPVRSNTTRKVLFRLGDIQVEQYVSENLLELVELPDSFQRWFGNSKVIDKQGDPMPVYHGSEVSFREFKKGDIGFHFGTKGQVDYRTSIPTPAGRITKDWAQVYMVYLRAENPITMKDATNWNDAYMVNKALYKSMRKPTNLIEPENKEAAKALLSDIRQGIQSGDLPSGIIGDLAFSQIDDGLKLQKLFKKHGFDSIRYPNYVEGTGDYSWIVFDSNQIKSIHAREFDPESRDIGEHGAYAPSGVWQMNEPAKRAVAMLRREKKKRFLYNIDDTHLPLKSVKEVIDKLLG